MSFGTRELVQPVEADEAWAAMSDLEEWLADDADLELEPGEEGTLVLPGGEERRARVEDVEPGTRIAFWWWAEDEPATHVELTLVPAVGGTRVRVVESGYAPGPVCRAAGGLMLVPA